MKFTKRDFSKIIQKLAIVTVCFTVPSFAADATYDNLTVNNRQGIGASPAVSNRLYVYRPGTEYGAGYSTIYGFRTGSSTATQGGTAWTQSCTDAALSGYSFWGNAYSAGVAAYSYLDYGNSAALVAAKQDGNYATYLAYCDPLSNNSIWSARFTNSIVMGPQIAGQRWIIFSDSHLFTIAPDQGTNFSWSKNFTINKNGGQIGIGMTPDDASTDRFAVNGNCNVNGNVGIGMSPNSSDGVLQVNGNAKINGNLTSGGQFFSTENGSQGSPDLHGQSMVHLVGNQKVPLVVELSSVVQNKTAVIVKAGDNQNAICANAGLNGTAMWGSATGSGTAGLFQNSSGNGYAGAFEGRVYCGGSMGLGIAPNSTYLLRVNGSIGCKELIVTNTGWADFVFNNKYNLKSLNEVEKYINKNKHLEGIPTEKDVNDKGVSVGAMQAKLLQKVEELTLYVIEQNKKIEKLQKANDDLSRRISQR
jgi:hypothetical protein